MNLVQNNSLFCSMFYFRLIVKKVWQHLLKNGKLTSKIN